VGIAVPKEKADRTYIIGQGGKKERKIVHNKPSYYGKEGVGGFSSKRQDSKKKRAEQCVHKE